MTPKDIVNGDLYVLGLKKLREHILRKLHESVENRH